MKKLFEFALIFCAICLFIAVLDLPGIYYKFLRVVVTIGAIAIAYFLIPKQWQWKLIFVAVAILFNPIFPIYLYEKSKWIPIDIITGILFLLIRVFGKIEKPKENKTIEQEINSINSHKTRDRIVKTTHLKKENNTWKT